MSDKIAMPWALTDAEIESAEDVAFRDSIDKTGWPASDAETHRAIADAAARSAGRCESSRDAD